jgi:ferredoxin
MEDSLPGKLFEQYGSCENAGSRLYFTRNGGIMADKSSKTPGNYPGTWYVDSTCIGCALCASIAPDVFTMLDDGTSAFVARQPKASTDTGLAAQALSDCPVGAIGNDA